MSCLCSLDIVEEKNIKTMKSRLNCILTLMGKKGLHLLNSQGEYLSEKNIIYQYISFLASYKTWNSNLNNL